MGVSARIRKQVTKKTVHEPRGDRFIGTWNLFKREFQFVKTVMPTLIDAGRLTRGPDEEPAKQPTQRRMVLPVSQQRPQQVWATQHWGIPRRCPTQNDVVPASGAGMTSIQHELFSSQSRLMRFLIKHFGTLN